MIEEPPRVFATLVSHSGGLIPQLSELVDACSECTRLPESVSPGDSRVSTVDFSELGQFRLQDYVSLSETVSLSAAEYYIDI